PQTTASAATKAPVATTSHGVVRMVGEALGEVPLRADQRATIEKLAQEAEDRHTPMVSGRRQLMLAFADQIETGTIDKAALEAQIDRVMADLEKTRAQDRAAIVKLHDVLDADQRNAFVDALEKQMKAKQGEAFDRMGGVARLKHLADELKLTDDQRS